MVARRISSMTACRSVTAGLNTFAQNLTQKIEESAENAVISIDTLNIEDDSDKNNAVSESNIFHNDLNNVVLLLQNFVLKRGSDLDKKQKLQLLFEKLNETSKGVPILFDNDYKLLQNKLKTSIQQVSGVAQEMLTIIKEDEVPGNKQKLIDIQCDLLCAIEKIKIRNEIREKSSKVIRDMLNKSVNGVWTALNEFLLDDDVVLHYTVHSIRHGVQHMQKVVHYLHRYGDTYEPRIHKMFDNAGNCLHQVLADLQATFQSTNKVEDMHLEIRHQVNRGCGEIGMLATLLEEKSATLDLKESVLVAITETLVNTYQLQRGLQHAQF